MPFELLDAMQMLAGNVEYIKVMRSGSNAVDMHIAYYVGRLIEKEPNAIIHIISGDSDFDPLVEYLQGQWACNCKRAKSTAEIAKQVHAKAHPRPAAHGHARAVTPAARKPPQRQARAHHQAAAFALAANPPRARNSRRPSRITSAIMAGRWPTRPSI